MRHFSSIHPKVILFFYIAILLPSMFYMDGGFLCVSLVTSFFWNGWLEKRVPWRQLMSSIGLIMVMIVVNSLLSHNGSHELFFVAGRAVTLESVIYGLFSGMMLAAVFSWFWSFQIIMGSEQIRQAFGRFRKLGLLTSLILRLVPEYIKHFHQVYQAMEINEAVEESTVKKSLRAVSATLTWALENSVMLAVTMEDRGYGSVPAKKLRLRKMEPADYRILGILVCMQGMYVLPYRGKLAVFCIMSLIPILYEGKEELRWALYKWRTRN